MVRQLFFSNIYAILLNEFIQNGYCLVKLKENARQALIGLQPHPKGFRHVCDVKHCR